MILETVASTYLYLKMAEIGIEMLIFILVSSLVYVCLFRRNRYE